MRQLVIVLGGGTFQRGLIAELKRLGFEVHVVTNRCHDKGALMAHQCHDFSFTELDRLTDLTKTLGAVQVLTAGSELGLSVQAEVQSRLGLKGNSVAFVNRFQDKFLYRKQLTECCADCVPQTFLYYSKDSKLLKLFVARFGQGVMVKPAFGGGSGGVAHCHDIQAVRDHLREYELSKAIVEEYVEGQEFGGDFLVASGQLLFEACTLKSVNQSQVPKSHLMLRSLQNNQERRRFLEEIIGHLKLTDGVYNADVLISKGQMKLIDLSPRIGGNCIPDLVKLSRGVNEWQFMTDQLLLNPLKIVKPEWHMSSGLFMIGADQAGTIESIMSENHPFGEAVLEVFWRLGPGDRVAPFTEGALHLGYVIYKATSDDELLKLQSEIESFDWFTLI